MSITAAMWRPRTPGMRKPATTERNRTVENLLKNNKTCPEESIYQIGHDGRIRPAGYALFHRK